MGSLETLITGQLRGVFLCLGIGKSVGLLVTSLHGLLITTASASTEYFHLVVLGGLQSNIDIVQYGT